MSFAADRGRLMRWASVLHVAIVTGLLSCALCGRVVAAQQAPAEYQQTAFLQVLVECALRAELDGRVAGRDALLQRALSIAPDYAPARWHSGFVRLDGQWLTVAEVEARAAADVRLATYAARRSRCADTGTKVTAEGLAKLKQALPNCNIQKR